MKLKCIAIVDDHPIFRIGIKNILQNDEVAEQILVFESGNELLEHLNQDPVDVVIVDLIMPEISGIETIQRAKEICPDIKIITISSVTNIEIVEEAIGAGSDGFINKTSQSEELSNAIRVILQHGVYFPPNIIIELSKRIRSSDTNAENTLSKRENELVIYLCTGLRREVIAKKLFISERTVDKHRENILKKMNCSNTISLLLKCVKDKTIDIEEVLKLKEQLSNES